MTKESALYQAIAGRFLSSHELGKITEKCRWDEETQVWTVPHMKKSKQSEQVRAELSAKGGALLEQDGLLSKTLARVISNAYNDAKGALTEQLLLH